MVGGLDCRIPRQTAGNPIRASTWPAPARTPPGSRSPATRGGWCCGHGILRRV